MESTCCANSGSGLQCFACSVVQIRAGDTSPDSIQQQVISALEQLADELEQGALVTVDIERSRVRLLPIRR